MGKYLIALPLLIASISAYAFPQTDYQCVNNCTSQGYQYGLCLSRCTWDNSPQPQPQPQPQMQPQPQFQAPKIKQTDYMCVNKCTSQGYQYGLCVDRCSY